MLLAPLDYMRSTCEQTLLKAKATFGDVDSLPVKKVQWLIAALDNHRRTLRKIDRLSF
jgi:hypothetical protein